MTSRELIAFGNALEQLSVRVHNLERPRAESSRQLEEVRTEAATHLAELRNEVDGLRNELDMLRMRVNRSAPKGRL